MSALPAISVCIPTYNRASLIGDAIESILQQYILPTEIIIVDNASSDNTEEIIKSFQSPILKYYRNQVTIGMCANWNKCLSLSSSECEIVTILHDDDWYFDKTTIDRVLSLFKKNSNASIVYSNSAKTNDAQVLRFDDGFIQNGYNKYTQGKEAALYVYKRGQLPCSSTFYRRSLALKCGGFSETYSYCCDEEFNSRMALEGDVVYHDHPFASYRRHSGHTMYDAWLKADFLKQYYESKIQMGKNAGLSEEEISKEVIRGLSRTLLSSSHMAFLHGRADTSRALHRSLLSLNPAQYMKLNNLKYLILHYIPKSYILYSLFRKYFKASRFDKTSVGH